jgi:hypothetical protein
VVLAVASLAVKVVSLAPLLASLDEALQLAPPASPSSVQVGVVKGDPNFESFCRNLRNNPPTSSRVVHTCRNPRLVEVVVEFSMKTFIFIPTRLINPSPQKI